MPLESNYARSLFIAVCFHLYHSAIKPQNIKWQCSFFPCSTVSRSAEVPFVIYSFYNRANEADLMRVKADKCSATVTFSDITAIYL